MKNIVMIGGHDETFMHYNGLGFDFTVLQLPDSVGPNLTALTDRIHLVNDFSEATVLARMEEVLLSQSVDFIFSFTEDGLLPAALASKHFAIPGMDYDTCERCIDKASMRSHLAGSEFAVTSKTCHNHAEVEQFLVSHPSGIVLKDPKGSGSENVFIIKDRTALHDALSRIGQAPFTLLAEEFLNGREVSVETLTIDSRHRVLAVTNKQLYGTSLAEEQHIISPDNVDQQTFENISGYCERLLTAIDHKHGPCHIEIMISGNNLHLVEINNRVGGDYIGLLVELTTGVDLFRETLSFHSTINGSTPDNLPERYTFAGSHLFYEPVNPDVIRDYMQEVDIIRLIMGDANPPLDRPHTNDDKVGLLVIASDDRDKFYRAITRLNTLTSAN
ncbi:ATP-grasp domain-containing protein [Pseudomonas koreensis]|uniref:ATP-grasp domain-containing protein n=1 Tax=Pseudomonas koreensis TaxID=198620 RepID=UPI001576C6DA|nr:ATP-grasp domain-containing protein [Pseudomonas koreensis]NTZ97621.1 ATP-grasp domain-containing protein [Pseudomonas koreensis]